MRLVMIDLPRDDATRTLLYATHKSLGISVLAIADLRLLLRLFTRATASSWQFRLARTSHVIHPVGPRRLCRGAHQGLTYATVGYMALRR